MHLLIVLEDRITDWETKGEILDGYFNPADAFGKVTVVSLLADTPRPETLARLCGDATVEFVCARVDRKTLFAATAGLRPGRLASRLRARLRDAVGTAPDVVRAYGDGLGAVAAAVLAAEMGAPYTISLHRTRDPDIERRFSERRDRIWRRAIAPAVERALGDADSIMAVYSPILESLPDALRARTVLTPNVVGVTARPQIAQREGGPFRAVWVSRHIPGRDARPVVRALGDAPGVELTLFGDGPGFGRARDLACELGLAARTTFVAAEENRRLCERLSEFDAILVNSAYREMPKSVMEAALSGLPVVVNRAPAAELPEYASIPALLVDGDARSYAAALRSLTDDASSGYERARATADAAWAQWDPAAVARRNADHLVALARRTASREP
jgi:glycosyltransferase involved in cell wall biosynthesis